MLSTLRTLGITVIILYVAIGIFLYLKQRSFLYFPTQNKVSTYPSIILENEEEKIQVLVLNKGKSHGLLYLGGNAESMASRASEIEKQFPEATVYLMDYRGFGGSTGEPTEKGLYSDALKLYDQVAPQHEQISVLGRSLGTGVATYVSVKRTVYKLALVTPYNSILALAQAQYPIYPIAWILHDSYDSAKRVKDIEAKTLIVLAESDKVIPYKYSKTLIEAFGTKEMEVITIKGTNHVNITSNKDYDTVLKAFMKEE
ncbi:MAG: alpha/beta hydrolase [Sulfurovum sp.]|nr:alpha/beta hydrolase [Sulfurovum sp.]